jgi:D-amino-acid dehydrogenase
MVRFETLLARWFAGCGPLPPYTGLFIANGHAMMGLTLGPVTGKLIAEYILESTASMNIAALCPGRF